MKNGFKIKLIMVLSLVCYGGKALAADAAMATAQALMFLALFDKNVEEVRQALAIATQAFLNGKKTLDADLQRLKAAKTYGEQEPLIVAINQQIIEMFEKFKNFFSAISEKFVVPAFQIAQQIPKFGDKMKFKSGKKVSEYFQELTELFNNVIAIQKKMTAKMNDIAAKVASQPAASAASSTASSAPISFDDL